MQRVAHDIPTDRLLTEDEARQVDAALKLAGLTRQEFAQQVGVGYSSLTKTLSRRRTPPPSHSKVLEELLAETNWPSNGDT